MTHKERSAERAKAREKAAREIAKAFETFERHRRILPEDVYSLVNDALCNFELSALTDHPERHREAWTAIISDNLRLGKGESNNAQ